MIWRRLTLCGVASLIAAGSSWAAGARLRGTVVDSEDAPLAGVQVTATSDELPAFRASVTSDKRGRFLLSFQQAQFEYNLLFEKPGFQSFSQPVQPKSIELIRETYVMEAAASEVSERHGDLAAVVTGSTNEAVAAYNRGIEAQRAGELDAAETELQAALVADPTLVPAHVALAQVLRDGRRFEEAVAATARALELEPGSLEALRIRYEGLRALGRRQEAEEVGELMAAAEGDVATARRLYHEAAEAYQAQELEGALAKFEEAAALDPSLVDAHHAIATIRLTLGNHEGSVEAAQRALALGSEDIRTLRVLYDAYDALGRIDDLLEIAPRLAKVDPEFGGPKLLEQAAALFNNGEVEKSATILQQVVIIDPTLGKTHYLLGLYHIQKGENAEARASFERFLEMEPDDPDAGTAREMLAYLE